MKTAVIAAILMFTFSAHAKINISSVISRGESTEAEATQLMSMLKALGVKGHARSGDEILQVNGNITITNGAACDNGHYSYSVALTEVDDNGKTVQNIDVDGANGCEQPSPAQKLTNLLDTWGGSTLELDCGVGHCWENINRIECRHYSADKAGPAFDSCTVELGSNG